MRKIIVTAAVATCTALSLVACGNNSSDNTTTGTVTETLTPPTGAESTTGAHETTPGETSVTSTEQLGMFDQAKLRAFVVAFRTAYSDLSTDRDDGSIENIVIVSCNDRANGADDQQVTETIRSLAANNGTEVTQDQAEHIYDMVKPACP